MEIITETIKKYKAIDGEVFSSEENCKKHEERIESEAFIKDIKSIHNEGVEFEEGELCGQWYCVKNEKEFNTIFDYITDRYMVDNEYELYGDIQFASEDDTMWIKFHKRYVNIRSYYLSITTLDYVKNNFAEFVNEFCEIK